MTAIDGFPCQAIFFDLFNTLILFDRSHLPRLELEGKQSYSTSPEVFRRLQEEYPTECDFDRFHQEYLESQRLVGELRSRDHREYSCLRRFEVLRQGLGLDEKAAGLMSQVHMEQVFNAMFLPEERRAVLEKLTARRLILASNFDDAPTLRRALREFQMEAYFQSVFISDEMGWRKPAREFFEILIRETGVDPKGCLYVGDDPDADVVGAVEAGFQVAWLSEQRNQEAPLRSPRWIIHSLPELVGIVNTEGRGPVRG